MRCPKTVFSWRLVLQLAVMLLMIAPADCFAVTKVLEAVYGTHGNWKGVSGLLELPTAGGTKGVPNANHTMGGATQCQERSMPLGWLCGIQLECMSLRYRKVRILSFQLPLVGALVRKMPPQQVHTTKQKPDEKAESATAQAKNDDAAGDAAPEVL